MIYILLGYLVGGVLTVVVAKYHLDMFGDCRTAGHAFSRALVLFVWWPILVTLVLLMNGAAALGKWVIG